MTRGWVRTCVFMLLFGGLIGSVTGADMRQASLPKPGVAHPPAIPVFAQTTGTGDGSIHIIPTLSAPSLKNGGALTIQAVVQAVDGVSRVEARIERSTGSFPGAQARPLNNMPEVPVAALTLKPAPANQGGVNALGTMGIWQAEWEAAGLEEGYYRVAITVTDRAGHTYSDGSLLFTDPITGLNTAGSTSYPNGGLARFGAVDMAAGVSDAVCGVIDSSEGHAYFGTDTSPGSVIKVSLASGATAPSCLGAVALNTGEDGLYSAVIDTANEYAYFGTFTDPGIVVKVALGSGASAPTRVGAVTLATGENELWSAVIDSANGYAYFGTYTSPGRVVKISLGSGAAAPTRVGAVTLSSGENKLKSGVLDTTNGYAYFGTDTSPGYVVKVNVGSGSAAPTRVDAAVLNSGEGYLHSAVIDTVNAYAYFGTYTSPGRIVKVALGSGETAPARLSALTLNSGEAALKAAAIDTANDYAYFGTYTSPARIVKTHLESGTTAPTRVTAITLDSGDNQITSLLMDPTSGQAYAGDYQEPSRVVWAGLSEQGVLKGTKCTMAETGNVLNVSFYSHAAAGNVRLAIYDNSTSHALLWESASTTNTAASDWLTVPIRNGTPSTLTLSAGTYWLAWQVDTPTPVASYTAGSSGNGFYVPLAYGPFPAVLDSSNNAVPVSSSETWSEYISYATKYSGGTGTEADPYLISNWADFVELGAVSSDWAACFSMICDVDMSGITQYSPIGNSSIPFTGVFDGGGYTVHNLYIDMADYQLIGLFGEVLGSTAVIKNVGIENATVFGNLWVGSLVGLLGTDASVINCHAAGTVTGSFYVGGLVGGCDGSIAGSHTTTTVIGNNWDAGGLVGFAGEGSAVTASYATGTVTGVLASGGFVGNVVGSTIAGCYATGAVTGTFKSAGGFAGYGGGVITACYATGAVAGNSIVGSFAGGTSGAIAACYATGAVTGAGESIGGFVGEVMPGMVEVSFWDKDTTGQSTPLWGSGHQGLATTAMKSISTFQNAGWFGRGWVMAEGEYPRLAWEGTGASPIPAASSLPLSGSGTDADPYLLTTLDDVALINQYDALRGKSLRLTADLECSSTAAAAIGALGPFTGVFDGDGHALRNMVIDQPEMSGVAFFSCVNSASAVIKNLTLEGGAMSGNHCVGGLVGFLKSGSVANCHTTCTVKGKGVYVGGLAGRSGGTITSCSASGAVAGDYYVGGLTGESTGAITWCYATGTVDGFEYENPGKAYVSSTPSYVGGLAGSVSGSLTSCFATGTVTGAGDYVGGLVGHAGSGNTIVSCFAMGAATGLNCIGGLVGYDIAGTTTSCYATGAVSGATYFGGLIGYEDAGTVTNCFWDTTTGGPDNAVGSGLPTVQMKQQATFTAAGWDFTTPVWNMAEAFSYPMLYNLPVPLDSVVSLQTVTFMPDGQFFLTKDIDAAETLTWAPKSGQPGFIPLCSSSSPFTGTLDGCGHRIYDVHISRPLTDQAGLFSYIGSAGVVKRLGLDNVDITGCNVVGALAGVNLGTVSQCYAQGTVSGTQIVGGLLGDNQGSVLESYAAAALTGGSVGGLLGTSSGAVANSFWDTMASGTLLSGGGTGLLTPAMQASSTFSGAAWDMAGTWAIAEGTSYPYFRNSAQIRVVTGPPCLIDADAVDIVIEAFVAPLFVTVGGGDYPVHYTYSTEGVATVSVPLKQEAINSLIISTLSTTGAEAIVARYSVYESDAFPSTPTDVTTLTINPLSASLASSATQQFLCLATFADGTSADVTPMANWNITGSGHITAGGLYTHDSGTATVQGVLHTPDGWRHSGIASVATAKGLFGPKSGNGRVSGVVKSFYSGLGLNDALVTAYDVFSSGVTAQYPVSDALGNYAFAIAGGTYSVEGSDSGFRSSMVAGGALLASGRYQGQTDFSHYLTYNFSLRPNDAQAPWVGFVEPGGDVTVNVSNLVVTAVDADKYSELATATFTLNTVEHDILEKISATGFYRATWTLAEGLNTLRLYTVDTEGNASERSVQVTYDPEYAGSDSDSDGDGLPDSWETGHGLDAHSADGVDGATGDLDADGLTNAQEYVLGTLPNTADSDGDGVSDGWEAAHGSDPLRDDRIKMAVVNPAMGQFVRGDAVTLLAEVTSGNPADIHAVAFEVMGASTGNVWRLIGTTTTAPFATLWNASALAADSYQLRAVATSTSGCVDDSPATISVNVSTTGTYYERITGGVHILTAPVSSAAATILALRDGIRTAIVRIPAGALSSDDTATLSLPAASGFNPALAAYQRDAGLYLNIALASWTGSFQNDKQATITLSYPDTDANDHLDDSGLYAPFLVMRYLPSPTSAFTAITSSTLDRTIRSVTGVTRHFSVFGLVAEQTMAPLTILTASLPEGEVGTVYTTTALTATGGISPYTWTVTGGTLPAGITLTEGVLSGTPTTAGHYTFTVKATDSQTTALTASHTYTVNVYTTDNPSVSITRAGGQNAVANALPATWAITFSQSVTGFDTGDVTLTGTASSGATYAVSGSGADYTLSVTALPYDGTLHLSVADGVAASVATSAATRASSNEEEVTVDRVAPVAQITCSNGSGSTILVSALPIVFTLEFSEEVTGLATGDITFTEGGITFVSTIVGSGKNYSIIVTGISAATTVTPALIAGAVQDSAGNVNGATAYAGPVVQYTPETRAYVSLEKGSSQADPTRAFPIVFTITFTKAVTGFTVDDVVYNGTATSPVYGLIGGGTAYTLTVTSASSDGRIGFYVPADVTNEGNTASISLDNRVDYDAARPSAALACSASDTTTSASLLVQADFSESVTGFTVSDIEAVNATVSDFSGSGSSYVFMLNPAESGIVSAALPADIAVDRAGNTNTASPILTRNYRGNPIVVLTSTASNPTYLTSIPVSATFNEAVTGLTSTELIVTNATVTGFTGSDASYSFNLVPSSQGTVTVQVPFNVASNTYAYGNMASTVFSRTYDTTPPSAFFSATVTTGAAPFTAHFVDASQPGPYPITAWEWNFGDGTTATDQNPAHVYTHGGDYTVSLTVTTAAGIDAYSRTAYIHVGTASPAVDRRGLAAGILAIVLCACLLLRRSMHGTAKGAS